jgi:integrase/recombinase XerD
MARHLIIAASSAIGQSVVDILKKQGDEVGMEHSISPHKLRHFLFTWLKKQGIDDALIQPYSGHESRKSLEIYSKLLHLRRRELET